MLKASVLAASLACYPCGSMQCRAAFGARTAHSGSERLAPIRVRPMMIHMYLYMILRNNCRSEEHTSELQSLMRISYAVFCLNTNTQHEIKLISYAHDTSK